MTLFQRLPRGGHTRSLSEHGSQAPHRRWYLAHGPGRVGRRWIHAPYEVNLAGGFFVLCGSRMNCHPRAGGDLPILTDVNRLYLIIYAFNLFASSHISFSPCGLQ